LDGEHELVEQNSPIATGVADVLIQRLQAAGFELQRALRLVEDDEARTKISSAVDNLNEAIKTIYLAAADFSSLDHE
jgi:hypothetical protein